MLIEKVGTHGILRICKFDAASCILIIRVNKRFNFLNYSRGELRTAQCITEDAFIRKFMVGTWHSLVLSEVIIKRQFNHIRIAGLIKQGISSRKMYFLIGYTEELLSYWLQCPVTLELQTVTDPKDVIFKYI